MKVIATIPFIAASVADAKTFFTNHPLSRTTVGTLNSPYSISHVPENPKRLPTIVDTSGACSMEPWIFLAIADSYPADQKFSIFGSKAGSNAQGQQDALWDSLVRCRSNKGVQKLMSLDAIANSRPDILKEIFDSEVNEDGYEVDTIKDKFFSNGWEFYKMFNKYQMYADLFHNSYYPKWYKINKFFQIMGDELNYANRWNDRRVLLQALPNSQPFSPPQPAAPGYGNSNGWFSSTWNNRNFLSGPRNYLSIYDSNRKPQNAWSWTNNRFTPRPAAQNQYVQRQAEATQAYETIIQEVAEIENAVQNVETEIEEVFAAPEIVIDLAPEEVVEVEEAFVEEAPVEEEEVFIAEE